VYDTDADAQVAAHVIPIRMDQYRSITTRHSVIQMLAANEGTLDTPQVYSAANGKYVALFTFRAPIESILPDSDGHYRQSGTMFGLLRKMIQQRDVYWLISTFRKS
jgi:hypothetical protein